MAQQFRDYDSVDDIRETVDQLSPHRRQQFLNNIEPRSYKEQYSPRMAGAFLWIPGFCLAGVGFGIGLILSYLWEPLILIGGFLGFGVMLCTLALTALAVAGPIFKYSIDHHKWSKLKKEYRS